MVLRLDPKDGTGFALHLIKLNGVNDLFSQIDAGGFGHGTWIGMSLSLVYALTRMAIAVTQNNRLNQRQAIRAIMVVA